MKPKTNQPMLPTLADLESFLRKRNAHPEQDARIDLDIRKAFTARRAIYISDMSGFSRIVQEYGIIHFLAMIQQMKDICLPVVERNHGALVKTEADNIFAVFDCVEDALRTALHVTREATRLDATLPPERQIRLSIGIGWGDILLIDYHDMYGDEMNLASKLGEDIAEAGEVLLTDSARSALLPGYVQLEERSRDISGVSLRYWSAQG